MRTAVPSPAAFAAHRPGRGFTLVETAIVLVIVTLLLGGILVPLAAQNNLRRVAQTQTTLEHAREALLGYAAANTRLPCPASATSNGLESFCTAASGTCAATTTAQAHGRCSNFFDGFLPAATLGFTPTDDRGYALDGWGLEANRIRYAVANTTVNSIDNPFTRPGGMRSAQMGNLSTARLLHVCSSAVGVNPAGPDYCGSAVTLASNAPAVVYSVGANAASPSGGAGTDESQNPNPNGGSADRIFVSHAHSGPGAPGGEYDDIVTWMSLHTLFNRMIAAGQLP